MIELKKIGIGYKEMILEANLMLQKGELYALIGKNGSGKTTFLQTLAGNIKTLSGTINVNQQDLATLSIHEKAKQIAFVETHFPNVQFMSGWEFISLGRTPHLGALGILNEEDNKQIELVFEYLEIQHLKNKYTNEMSDGERQTLLVARSLVQQTDIILLDEPSAFLDYLNKRKLIEKLIQTTKDLQKCIIFSSHDIELCLEFHVPILLVNDQLKTVEISISNQKAEILKEAFGLKI